MIDFFFNDTATTEIYTLSLHDALPISHHLGGVIAGRIALGVEGVERVLQVLEERVGVRVALGQGEAHVVAVQRVRSEEHTSELQSHLNIVCRLLLEKINYAQTT